MYLLEPYDGLAKTRAILDSNENPVAWIDYDDCPREEADEIANRMLAGLNGMYVTGLLDEVEFMGQLPEQHLISVYGPFPDIESAQAHARTLSTDPDEAVVVPVKGVNRV